MAKIEAWCRHVPPEFTVPHPTFPPKVSVPVFIVYCAYAGQLVIEGRGFTDIKKKTVHVNRSGNGSHVRVCTTKMAVNRYF